MNFSGDFSMKYRLIIGVHTCPKNLERVEAVKQTWLSKKLPDDVLVLFVYGDDGGVTPRLEGDNLYLPSKECYELLPEKTYDFLKYCIDNFDFDHVFKCDDDLYLDIDTLLNYPFANKDYAGQRFYSFRNDRQHHYLKADGEHKPYKGKYPDQYMLGNGYVLSKRAAQIITSKSKNEIGILNLDVGYEDVMVGYLIEEYNKKHADKLTIVSWKKLGWPIILHPCSNTQIKRYHAVYKRSRFIGNMLTFFSRIKVRRSLRHSVRHIVFFYKNFRK